MSDWRLFCPSKEGQNILAINPVSLRTYRPITTFVPQSYILEMLTHLALYLANAIYNLIESKVKYLF